MNAEQVLNKIKTALGFEVKLEQLPLEDGMTIVEAEKFEPEFSIGIVTEEGIVALPMGEYILEDGRKLIINEEGIIGEVLPAEEAAVVAQPVEAPEEMAVAQMEEAPSAPKKVVESIVKESFFSEIEALKKENEELTKKVAELSAVKEAVKEEVELEAVKPIVHNPEPKEAKATFKFAKNAKASMMNRVLNKINN